jgi:nucleotide-binding universal stress UspA family protein
VSVIVGYLAAPRGRLALEAGIAEARLRNTDLVVVHSIHGERRSDDEEAVASDRDLEELKTRLEGEGIEFTVKNFIRGNEPAEDIVQAARDLDGELIVIGLRKRTAAGKFLLGSNAHDILMQAECPVLAVRVQ